VVLTVVERGCASYGVKEKEVSFNTAKRAWNCGMADFGKAK
jgi:hypothetical protein